MPRGHNCRPITDATQAVLDWRHARILHSRARYLRLAEELEDVQRQIAELQSLKVYA